MRLPKNVIKKLDFFLHISFNLFYTTGIPTYCVVYSTLHCTVGTYIIINLYSHVHSKFGCTFLYPYAQ